MKDKGGSPNMDEIEKWHSLLGVDLFRLILETSTELISINDLGGKPLLINRAWTEKLGYSIEDIEDLKNLVHPDDLERFFYSWEALVSGKEDLSRIRYRLRDRWGKYLFLESSASKVRTEEGYIFFLVSRDITEQMKIEESLMGQTMMLGTILNSIPDVIGIQYPDHRILQYNEAGYRMLGLTREEIQGKKCHELIGKDEPCRVCASSEVLRTGRPNRVERYEDALGIWLDVRAYPVLGPDNELLYIIEHLRDITKEKENEQKLRFRISLENVISSISADFINMPVDKINEGIDKSLERIGRLVTADRSYVFLYRGNGTRMDNTHEWCDRDIPSMKRSLQGLDPDDFYCVRQLKASKKELSVSNLDQLPEEARPDREEFEKEGIKSFVMVPLLSGDQDIGFIGFDSVKRKRDWSQDSISLLKIVGEIIVSALLRRDAQEELIIERKRAELYLDLLGHDIGNIHQGIHTSLQLAHLSPRDEDRKVFAMNSAQELTKRSIKLVHNVLLLSKLRSREPELTPIMIDEVLEQSRRILRDVFPNREIDVRINCPGRLSPIMAEPIISELFFNLIHNGIKFQENGNPVVEIDVMEIDNRVQITVSDHGPGIPDHLKEYMFQRFNKGGNGSQTGLGLSLVKELVDRYKGTIAVMDRVIGDHSQGALFLLSFPTA